MLQQRRIVLNVFGSEMSGSESKFFYLLAFYSGVADRAVRVGRKNIPVLIGVKQVVFDRKVSAIQFLAFQYQT